MRGGMKSGGSSEVTEEMVAELGQKCEELDGSVRSAKERFVTAEQVIRDSERALKDADMRAKQLEVEVKSLADQKKALSERLAATPEVTLSKEEKEAQKAAEKIVEERRKELDSIVAIAKKHEDTIKELHEEIINAGGQNLQDKKGAEQAARKKVDDTHKSLQKKKIEAENGKKNAVKARAAAEKARTDLDATNKTILALEVERKEVDAKAEDVLVMYQATRDSLESKEAEEKKVKDLARAARRRVAGSQEDRGRRDG